MTRTLVWFRGKDLRLSDHLPLRRALDGGDVIPLFVLDPFFFEPERAALLPHRMQFLLDSLDELARSIAEKGSRLLLVAGRSVDVVPRLADQLRVDRIVAQRWTEPFGRVRDERVARRSSVPFELFEGETLIPPGTLRSGSGSPYAVFTPFARAFARAIEEAVGPLGRPLPAPKKLPPLPRDITLRGVTLPTCEQLGIERNRRILQGGEKAGRKRLERFIRGPGAAYDEERDRLDRAGSSRLSADLKLGTLSPRTVWWAVERRLAGTPGAPAFQRELLWREFNYDLLWNRPTLLNRPFRPEYGSFPWRFDEEAWRAWASGRTGYPVVDAAARQLLAEGYVPNRARMISASFLTKHLLIHYRYGERHYLQYLTDGDWAQNNANWQWCASSGADAQPYFRVFHPVTQGERFDPTGDYVRTWVPELERLPTRYLHAPWTAPSDVLAQAGVRLGQNYPEPIVDHAEARTRYLYLAEKHLRKGRKATSPRRRGGGGKTPGADSRTPPRARRRSPRTSD